MAEETIDPGLLEQTKNQIRKLVAEIAELAESDIQPPEFHTEFLTRVIAAVAASGGVLWLTDGRGGLKLQHQVDFRQTGLLDNRQKAQPHDALLGVMLQASQPQIIPPGAAVEGMPNAGNPTTFALILAPLLVDKQCVGLVEILMDPTRRAATQKSTLRFVSDLCDLAAQYLKNRQMRQMVSQQKLWGQLENFTHAIHNSLDLRETAYAVANDGKRLVGCDRFSVAMKIGGRMSVEAVSGQEIVEHRANLIREMTKLCKVVAHTGEDLVYTGTTEGFPPEVRDALEVYVDESGAKSVIVTLLHKPESEPGKDKDVYGCLVAEQIGDEMAPTDAQARAEVVSRHASTALWNAQEHDKIFMLPLLKAIGSPWRFFRGRTLAKILGVLGAILGVILIMSFMPYQLTIEGKGSLLPEGRRTTYAANQGVVVEVFVEHEQEVKEGQLLARLENKELDKEHRKLIGEKAEASSKLQNVISQITKMKNPDEKIQLDGERAQAEIKLESIGRQLEIIEDQRKMLEITAPIAGIVTTWETKKNLLNRPVEVGTELIQIAAIKGPWVMEVEVPDDDMAPILATRAKLRKKIKDGTAAKDDKIESYFVTMTDPEHRYNGYVQRIAAKADTIEGKHVVKVTVAFSDEVKADYMRRNDVASLRPGAEVRARVRCGDARLAYVVFRDVIQVWHETVLFRWPFLK